MATPFNRRQVLIGLGAAGVGGLLRGGSGAWAACAVTQPETEGPFWVDENLNRSDIRVDPSDGSTVPGLPLTLTITLLRADGECAPAAGVQIDVWHCSAAGLYSDEASNGTSGKKYLRGWQATDANGRVRFTTIYPGWYTGRTIHIHVRVRTFDGASATTNFTTQLYFDDTLSEQVIGANAAYQHGTRTTFNTNDMLYMAATQLALTSDGSGGYAGTVELALNGLPVGSAPTPAPTATPATGTCGDADGNGSVTDGVNVLRAAAGLATDLTCS